MERDPASNQPTTPPTPTANMSKEGHCMVSGAFKRTSKFSANWNVAFKFLGNFLSPPPPPSPFYAKSPKAHFITRTTRRGVRAKTCGTFGYGPCVRQINPRVFFFLQRLRDQVKSSGVCSCSKPPTQITVCLRRSGDALPFKADTASSFPFLSVLSFIDLVTPDPRGLNDVLNVYELFFFFFFSLKIYNKSRRCEESAFFFQVPRCAASRFSLSKVSVFPGDYVILFDFIFSVNLCSKTSR